MSAAYTDLLHRLREAATLTSTAHLLGWDQETMMPPKAAGCRAEELELVAELAHRRSIDPQIGEQYRAAMTGAQHSFIIGLGNDEIGYQLPAEKWDDSCHACAPFVLGGVPQLCPLFPNIDCNTVFQNNVGQAVDPAISAAMYPVLAEIH